MRFTELNSKCLTSLIVIGVTGMFTIGVSSCVLDGNPTGKKTKPQIQAINNGAEEQDSTQQIQPLQSETEYEPVEIPDSSEEAIALIDELGLEFTTTGFHNTIRDGKEDYYRLFLAAGIDPLAIDETKNKKGYTSLMVAVRAENLKIATKLIAQGAEVNAVLPAGEMTALHFAAYTSNLAIIELLLESGADIEALDMRGWTPICFAAAVGSLEALETFISAGADYNHLNNKEQTVLCISMLGRNLEVTKRLVGLGIDVNARDDWGGSALWVASRKQELEILEYLISQGANVNIGSDVVPPPLHIAARRGHLGVLELLLNSGADIHQRDEHSGMTALHFAAQHGMIESARMLLDAGIDAHAVENDNHTALDLARIARDVMLENGGDQAVVAEDRPSSQQPDYLTRFDIHGLIALLSTKQTLNRNSGTSSVITDNE